MENAEIILRVGELLGEDSGAVAESFYVVKVERAPTLEVLSSIEKELRRDKHIYGTRVWDILEKRRQSLSLIEVQNASTKDEIVRAFHRSRNRYTEAYNLAIYKMAMLLEKEGKEKVKMSKDNDPRRHQLKC